MSFWAKPTLFTAHLVKLNANGQILPGAYA